MVKAQEWLDHQYPHWHRKEVTKLDLNKKELEGSLNLEEFFELEELYCYNNQLTSLVISNCPKLTYLDCSMNKLTYLDLNENSELNTLNCHSNKLTKRSDFCLPFDKKKLISIAMFNNNFSGDLEIFREYTNLTFLNLKNSYFAGSLEHLKGLNKLKGLHIDNTDIDSGLEYLPDSIEKFSCEVLEIFDYSSFGSKVGKLYDELEKKECIFIDNKGEKKYGLTEWKKIYPVEIQTKK